MKGGFNNPPNLWLFAGCSQSQAPSMKGGFNNPPNDVLKRKAARGDCLQ